jgi:ribonuclease HI
VRGHNGNIDNERVDKLARAAAENIRQGMLG